MPLPHAFSMLSALALTLFAGSAPGAPASAVMTYRGSCDASAAVALDADHFVVAGDEDNTLRVYSRGRPEPVGEAPLATFLDSGNKESDLEAAAAVGKRIYWIASHGRNSKGKPRPDRQRFFATDIDPGAQPGVTPAGTPYRGLLEDLAAAPTLAGLRLGDAARLAPEAPGGLNIEGLAAMPDGSLLVGFRSPVPNGRALLVPLLNPSERVHDLLRSKARNARWTNCRLVLSHRSQFFHSRRFFSSHAKLRSTIQRLGMTAKARSSLRLAICTVTCSPRISRTPRSNGRPV